MSLFTSQPGLVALLESEKDGIAERRGAAGNMHECSARMEEAIERAEAATKEQKKVRGHLWSACKDGDATEFDAYAKQIRDTAMLGALAWLTVAAEADRAIERAE